MFSVLKKILEIIGIIAVLLNITFLPIFLAYKWLYDFLAPVILFLDSLPVLVTTPLLIAFVLVMAWIIIKILRDFL